MLRIVAGKFGGRRIQTPPGRNTRPTSEKVRGALFNALEQWIDLDGVHVVDLYAGSGALGIEALSRGAMHVTFVESDARTAMLIWANLKTLEIPPNQAEVVVQKAVTWVRRTEPGSRIQLVLLDPPYAAGEYAAALNALAQWPGLVPGAILAVESRAREDLNSPPGLEVLRAKRYGDTQLQFLRKSESEQALPSSEPVPAEEEP